MSRLIFTTTDKGYIEQAVVFLRSLAKNSHGEYPVVSLVDCGDEENSIIKAAHPDVVTIMSPLPEGVDRRGFMVCHRAELVLRGMRECDTVAWMDSDVIVRSNLDGFWDGVEKDCLKITVRPDSREDSRFQAGVFAVGVSDATLEMVDRWRDSISGTNKWYADQLWLWKCYQKHRENVKLVDMPKMIHNVGTADDPEPFKDDSIIWHCKGSHFNHPTYQKEYRRYLED